MSKSENRKQSIFAGIWRYKFVLFSLLFFFAIFLILKSGLVMHNPDNDILRVAQTDSRIYEKYSREMRMLLLQGKFDTLDNIAAQLRKTKERYPGGAWKLEIFYDGIADVESEGNGGEGEWRTITGKLEQWVKAQPDSLTAKVALAQAYTGYAWKARGNGYGDTVSDEQYRIFQERLKKAETVLNQAKTLPEKCPNWYATMQMVALGQGWDLARYNQLFDEAVTVEPFYHPFYENKAVFLLPRWYGQEGDWQKFAEEVAAKHGSKEGSILYFYIAWGMIGYYGSEQFFSETKLSWPKLKQGFNEKSAMLGVNNSSENFYCLLACMAKDRPAAQASFAKIGDAYDPFVWGAERRFYNYKAWASDNLIDRVKLFLFS